LDAQSSPFGAALPRTTVHSLGCHDLLDRFETPGPAHGTITGVVARTAPTTLADRVGEVSMDIRHAWPIGRVGNAAMHAASPQARSALHRPCLRRAKLVKKLLNAWAWRCGKRKKTTSAQRIVRNGLAPCEFCGRRLKR
jgi:hypothetical protein